jgi:hypothetical protein
VGTDAAAPAYEPVKLGLLGWSRFVVRAQPRRRRAVKAAWSMLRIA